ncbi:MAG: Ig-like domain-containing protein [Gemmatimonadaceae bacterium]
MQKLTRSLLAFSAVVGLAACGDDVTVTPPPTPVPPTVTGVTVAPTSVTIQIGEKVVFSAALQTNGTVTNTAVTWSTANATIASVSATGEVTGNAAGTTTIRATSAANAAASGAGSVTVVPPSANLIGLTVAPTNANLGVGGTVQIVANATKVGNPTVTYTYATSNAGVATVNASGLVTAVGNGTAVITTTGTTSTNSLSAATTINVASASVSIASITTGGAPVTLNNVFGQFEVTMNISAGSQTLDSVEVRLGGVPAASQVFTVNGAPNAPVTLSINSGKYTLNNTTGVGVPAFLNGSTSVQANVYVHGASAPTASNTIAITLNNYDTFHAAVTNPTNSASGALGPNGTLWYGGPGTSVGLQVYPVFYSGKSAAQATFGFGGCGAVTDTSLPFSNSFSCAGVSAGNQLSIVTAWLYTDATNGVLTPIVSNPLPVPGGTYVFANNPLVPIQIDNVAPGGVALTMAVAPNNWINAAFDWTSITTRGSDAGGVGLAASSTDKYEYQDLPATAWTVFPATPHGIPEDALDFTNAAYDARVTVKDLLGNASTVLQGGASTFGVDVTPPTIEYTGALTGAALGGGGNTLLTTKDSTLNDLVASYGTVTSLTALYGVRIRDERSGFDIVNNNYYHRKITRLAPSGTTCAEGGVGCAYVDVALAVGNDDPTFRRDSLPVFGTTGGLTGTSPGYYTFSAWTNDRAGNSSTAVSKKAAIDIAAPQVTGINFPAVLAGASNVAFVPNGQDDLEVNNGALYLTYPNMPGGALRYSSYAAIDAPWNSTLATPVGNGAAFGAAGFSVPHGFLNGIDVVCSAAIPLVCAGNDSTPPLTVSATYAPTFVASQFYDIKHLAAATALTGATPDSSGLFSAPLLPGTTTPGTPFSVVGVGQWYVFDVGTPAGSAAQARAKTSTSITNPPFPQVAFFRQNADGTWQFLGTVISQPNPPTNNPTHFDQGSNRFWTYTLTSISPALTTGQLIRAVGMSAAGDGLSTQTYTIP